MRRVSKKFREALERDLKLRIEAGLQKIPQFETCSYGELILYLQTKGVEVSSAHKLRHKTLVTLARVAWQEEQERNNVG